MDLWTEKLDSPDSFKVDEHEYELIANEILESYVPPKSPSPSSSGDYMTRSEVVNLMEGNIKTHCSH